jgi:hypothetical protein
MEPNRSQKQPDLSEMQVLMGKAIWQAVTRHKKLGEPVAVWQNGRVVTLSAEDIPTPNEDPL